MFANEVAIENPGAPYILRAPLRCLVVGGSGSGKTSALLNCVCLPELSPFACVIWCGPTASLNQSKLQYAKEVLDERAAEKWDLEEGLILVPCDDKIDKERVNSIIDHSYSLSLPTLIVFDDLYTLGGTDQKFIAEMFTAGRHRLVSVAELRQRVYGGTAGVRDVRLSCNCFILCDFGEKSEVSRLLKGRGGEEAEFALRCYNDALRDEHGFLLIDDQARGTDAKYRYRRCGLGRLFVRPK